MNGTHLTSKTEKHYNILGRGPSTEQEPEKGPEQSPAKSGGSGSDTGAGTTLSAGAGADSPLVAASDAGVGSGAGGRSAAAGTGTSDVASAGASSALGAGARVGASAESLVPADARSNSSISLVCLFRGRRYQRIEDIQKVAQKGFPDILFILTREGELPYDELVAQYPNIRLMFFSESALESSSYGSLINAAVAEARGKFVLVLWNGMELQIPRLNFVDRSILCHLPLVLDSSRSSVPSMYVPTAVKRGRKDKFVEPFPVLPSQDDVHGLFPYDFVGLYNKKRFEQIGGYSEDIRNTYWQKLEFGYRAWLWGEEMQHLQGFCVEYSENAPIDEKTVDNDYLRFSFRTLALSYLSDHAELANRKFWQFFRSGNRGIVSAWREFKKEQAWVASRAYRYKYDIEQLLHLWGESE